MKIFSEGKKKFRRARKTFFRKDRLTKSYGKNFSKKTKTL